MAVIVTRFLQHCLDPAQKPSLHCAPAVAIGILIIPLFDTLRVFTLRVAAGKSPFKADRLHVHHRLIDLGLSHFEAMTIILLVNMLFIVLALLLRNSSGEILILTELVLATILSYIPVWLLKRKGASKEPSSVSVNTATAKGGKGVFFQVLGLLSTFFQF
jgi:UDP-GlcNAc:undecaprenyl-phosphate GlcNAc-1-phosphate transferase